MKEFRLQMFIEQSSSVQLGPFPAPSPTLISARPAQRKAHSEQSGLLNGDFLGLVAN